MQKVLFRGAFACFTRPELGTERVSYDVPTPSACIGMLEAIYFKPEMRWHIEEIDVLRPIQWQSLRRLETSKKASRRAVVNVARSEDRILRHSTILRDVAYVIHARIEALDGSGGKHVDCFRRRLSRGECFSQPFLGCREFVADFEPVSSRISPDSSLDGERDLGFMLHTLDYSMAPPGRRWYRPIMRDGVIRVPSVDSVEVRS